MRIIKKNIFFLAFLLLLSGCAVDYDNVYVREVIDGDTIRLFNGEKVRLLGIDCPELYPSDKLTREVQSSGKSAAEIQAQGKLAYEFTRDLAEGKVVRLEFDEETLDQHGRFLAYVFLEDGSCLNAKIIKAGYAIPFNKEPNTKYAGWFEQLYFEARKNKKGLWNKYKKDF